MWRNKLVQLLFSSCLFCIYPLSSVQAQITPDRSLGNESSIVTPDATVKDAVADLISGGAVRGNNLFHSFSEFNVGDGGRVYFANPDGIANILTRVTGNNLSKIFGTLGVDGAANLFLLNPNGIIFGKDAKLDVNGSFLATTADRFVFKNGFEYSASNPEAPPLLTINMPLGLQFGVSAKAIEVGGTGNNLRILDEMTFALMRDERPAGLEVTSGHTLALIGGDINLTGGNLTAPQGRIELGSVAQNSNVSLIPTDDGFSLGDRGIANFKDISLTEAASIDASGKGSGNLQLQAKNISLLDSSAIVANTIGTENGGKINLTAANSVEMMDTDLNPFPSSIFSLVEPDATGKGSKIAIEANNLLLDNGSLLVASTFGVGDGGDSLITANHIELMGVTSVGGLPGGLFANSYGTGKSGNFTINTDSLQLKDVNQISSSTFDAGLGGNLSITANHIEIIGATSVNGFPIPSGLFASSYSTGKAGNFTINTDTLQLKDGGQILSGTFGVGDGGNLSITANHIEIIGATSVNGLPIPSALFSGNYSIDKDYGTGKGGNITIVTDNLLLKNGGFIVSGTFGVGDGGNLSITAHNIEVTSGLFAGSYSTGKGGNITIVTDNLLLKDGGQIASGAFSTGNSGDLSITANNVELIGIDPNTGIASSGIFASVEPEATGNAGKIDLEIGKLSITDGAQITSSTFGKGNAGNLEILARQILVSGISANGELPSRISAFSKTDAAAGSIKINSDNVTLTENGEISVSNSGSGNAGNLNINTQELFLDNSGKLRAEVAAGSQGNINLTTDNIFLRNNSEITAKATGIATGGNIAIDNTDNIVLLENSRILANAIQGNGGDINITTQGLFVFPNSLISASSEFGLNGNVKVEIINSDRYLNLNKLPENPINASQQITRGCSAGNNFAVVGNGGLPENPTQTNLSSNVWNDLRVFAREEITNSQTSKNSSEKNQSSKNMIEAIAWKINARGQIELFSPTKTDNLPHNSINCS